jgi:hypothetical protein
MHGTEAVPGQNVESGLCLLLVPELAIEPGKQARVNGIIWAVGLQAFQR